MRIRWTVPALSNLADIQDYITEDSPTVAARVTRAIRYGRKPLGGLSSDGTSRARGGNPRVDREQGAAHCGLPRSRADRRGSHRNRRPATVARELRGGRSDPLASENNAQGKANMFCVLLVGDHMPLRAGMRALLPDVPDITAVAETALASRTDAARTRRPTTRRSQALLYLL